MGNCQVSEAATVAIQHPGGRVDRLCWPTTASEVMKNHPGHHVAVVTLPAGAPVPLEERRDAAAACFTRARLLKPGEALVLGQVYRLVTDQEVTKAIGARKNDKMKRREAELMEERRRQQQQQRRKRSGGDDDAVVVHRRDPAEGRRDGDDDDPGNTNLQAREQQQKTSSSKQQAGRHRRWRPSLKSIEEIGS